MQRQPRSIDDAVRLLQLSELIASSTRTVIDEWTKESKRAGTTGEDGSPAVLPNWRLYQAQRELLAAAGTLTELASDPSSRLQEVSGQYFEARALHIAAEKRIADVIAELDTDGEGVPGDVIAEKVGIEPRKLSKLDPDSRNFKLLYSRPMSRGEGADLVQPCPCYAQLWDMLSPANVRFNPFQPASYDVSARFTSSAKSDRVDSATMVSQRRWSRTSRCGRICCFCMFHHSSICSIPSHVITCRSP